MGLATVHGIVHEHGGHVVVETTLGRGSAFRVLLPLAEETAAKRDRPARAAASRSLDSQPCRLQPLTLEVRARCVQFHLAPEPRNRVVERNGTGVHFDFRLSALPYQLISSPRQCENVSIVRLDTLGDIG